MRTRKDRVRLAKEAKRAVDEERPRHPRWRDQRGCYWCR
jgi:hypothetical protein